jgi:hypothetical protein
MEPVSGTFNDIKDALGVSAEDSWILREMDNPTEVFKGYVGRYHYLSIDGVEFSQSLIPAESCVPGGKVTVEEEAGPLRIGHSSSCYMAFRVTETPVYEDDPISPEYVLCAPLYSSSAASPAVPVLVQHADVSPSLLAGDTFTAQCTFVASAVAMEETAEDRARREEAEKGEAQKNAEPSESKTETAPDKYAEAGAVTRLQIKKRVRTVTDPVKCRIEGEITASRFFPAFEMPGYERLDSWLVRIRTIYGIQTLVFTDKALKKARIRKLQRGDRISAAGWLIADLATVEYQNGAVFDEAHFLLSLISSIRLRDSFRLESCVAEDAILLETAGSCAKGQSRVISRLLELFLPENVGRIARIQVGGRTESALVQESDSGLAAFGRDAKPLFLLFFTRDEAGRITSISVDYQFTDYQWGAEKPRDLYIGTPDAEHPVDSLFARYVGFKDAHPLVDRHMSSPGDVWTMLFDSPKEAIAAVKQNRANGVLVHETSADGPEGYWEEESMLRIPHASSLGFVTKKKTEFIFDVPVVPGTPVEATFRSTFAWFEESSLLGEVTFANESWNEPLSAFVPYFFRSAYRLAAGDPAVFDLAAVACDIHKAEPAEYTIDRGPFYEVCLKTFLDENPGKTELDFPELKIQTAGMKMMMPTPCSSIYIFRTTIKEVERIPFYDGILYRCAVDLFVGRDPEDQDTLSINLFMAPTTCGDYVPQAGDDIEGTMLLTVSRIDAVKKD